MTGKGETLDLTDSMIGSRSRLYTLFSDIGLERSGELSKVQSNLV